MKKIALIICWFGPYPNYFSLWLKSVTHNPTIDFFIFGDHELGPYAPSNVKFFKTSLEKLEIKLRTTLHHDKIVCEKSYKLCDFRPMFGDVFKEELSGYDFWGHCDIDLVFGNLRNFLTDEKLNKYDKIYPGGHLSVYRNTEEVNARWRIPHGKFALEDVLTNPLNFDYDEWEGIYNVYMRNGFPFFREVEYFNPICFAKRYRFRQRSNPKYEQSPIDYHHQCFYWEDGCIWRAFIQEGGGVSCEEGAYIHLEKRTFPYPVDAIADNQAFFCTPFGFIKKDIKGIPDRSTIKRMNPFYGEFFERVELFIIKKKRKFIKKIHPEQCHFAPRSMKIQGAGWENYVS